MIPLFVVLAILLTILLIVKGEELMTGVFAFISMILSFVIVVIGSPFVMGFIIYLLIKEFA